MSNPIKTLTVFDFYTDSFEDLPKKMEEQVGYQVKALDIWSINISLVNRQLHVTLTIIYWEDKMLRNFPEL